MSRLARFSLRDHSAGTVARIVAIVLATLTLCGAAIAQQIETPVPTPLEPTPEVVIDDDSDSAAAVTPDAAALDARIVAGRLELRQGDELLWGFSLPKEGGATAGPAVEGEQVLVTHGLYLLTLSVETGNVLQRTPLPAEATSLPGGDDSDGAGADLTGPVRFGADPEPFGGLRRAAASYPAPAQRAERDPTDPWVALEAARAAGLASERADWIERSLEAAEGLPFFESFALAGALLDLGADSGAETLYEAAINDFAERGYDPRLASDARLRDAYSLPESHLADALERGDMARAMLIAPYAWRMAAEEAPRSVELLHAFADALRDAGEREDAGSWRQRARALDRSGLSTWVDAAALRLAQLGWWGATSLTLAFVLLWTVLLAKVWRAQSLARRQRRERGDRTWPWTRLWVVRQASTTEKLALIALLVLAGLYAGLASWQDGSEDVDPALRSGTLASAPAVTAVEALPETPHAWWVRGLSQLQRGNEAAARDAWQAAGDLAPALVDLAVLDGNDPELLEAALATDPREPVARFLTGRSDDPSPLHASTLEDEPLWSVPSPLDLRLAVAGDWRGALSRIVTEPWFALPEARPVGVPSLVWWLALVVYAGLLLTLTLALAIPRPRVARFGPRSFGYHLGALAIPGSGHADELWGLLLLVPWSLLMADVLQARQTGSYALGLGPDATAWLLAALWTINLIGFTVELSSYRRRMRVLRERSPELAISYGLRPTTPPEEE